MHKNLSRCPWANASKLMQDYHDHEWGVPIFDDQKLFEFLILESFQAGLSWETVLKKRSNFTRSFANFNPKKVAQFNERDVTGLLNNPGIIRNRLKILAAINNAKRFLEIQKEYGEFSKYIWEFVDFKPIQNKFNRIEDIPAKTELSDKISKDLIKRGFKFVGSTTIYAHLQATGMVNDHLTSCFRYLEV